jgi:hypothetical protein
MTLILSGTDGLSDVDGSAATPAIRGTDTNTGIFFPAADTIAFSEGGTESARFDASGNLGIGTTSPGSILQAQGEIRGRDGFSMMRSTGSLYLRCLAPSDTLTGAVSNSVSIGNQTAAPLIFHTGDTERMRIDSSGNLLVGKTTSSVDNAGITLFSAGDAGFTRSADVPIYCNRKTNDGTLISLQQDNTQEGTISVSGTTVSYNGGHLSRWSQLPDNSKDDTILKGTVLTNLDDMCVWEKDGVVAENEQLNKMKVSNVEGDTNVAGVFVNWTKDEDYNSDDMNIAMTGDMIIRIADGVVVQKGDLLMSAGDGTAKPQGDDIVRSKTIAKVTSNHVTCTYADGSYCVPCVLMAC